MKKFLKIVIGIVVFGYFAIIGLLYAVQDALVFPAPAPITYEMPQNGELLEFSANDGAVIKPIFLSASPTAPYVLFFHGNGSAAQKELERGREYVEAGYNVVLAEYQGYGESTGSPNIDNILEEALSQFDWIASKQPSAIYIVGHSLGTGPALYVASKRESAAVALEAPYSNTVDVASWNYPYVPVSLLLRHQFVSTDYIKQVDEPILIMHGNNDRTIPIEFGERLFQASKKNGKFIEVDGAGHSLRPYGFTDRTIAFFLQNQS